MFRLNVLGSNRNVLIHNRFSPPESGAGTTAVSNLFNSVSGFTSLTQYPGGESPGSSVLKVARADTLTNEECRDLAQEILLHAWWSGSKLEAKRRLRTGDLDVSRLMSCVGSKTEPTT